MNTMDVQSQHTWTMKQKIKKKSYMLYMHMHTKAAFQQFGSNLQLLMLT